MSARSGPGHSDVQLSSTSWELLYLAAISKAVDDHFRACRPSGDPRDGAPPEIKRLVRGCLPPVPDGVLPRLTSVDGRWRVLWDDSDGGAFPRRGQTRRLGFHRPFRGREGDVVWAPFFAGELQTRTLYGHVGDTADLSVHGIVRCRLCEDVAASCVDCDGVDCGAVGIEGAPRSFDLYVHVRVRILESIPFEDFHRYFSEEPAAIWDNEHSFSDEDAIYGGWEVTNFQVRALTEPFGEEEYFVRSPRDSTWYCVLECEYIDLCPNVHRDRFTAKFERVSDDDVAPLGLPM